MVFKHAWRQIQLIRNDAQSILDIPQLLASHEDESAHDLVEGCTKFLKDLTMPEIGRLGLFWGVIVEEGNNYHVLVIDHNGEFFHWYPHDRQDIGNVIRQYHPLKEPRSALLRDPDTNLVFVSHGHREVALSTHLSMIDSEVPEIVMLADKLSEYLQQLRDEEVVAVAVVRATNWTKPGDERYGLFVANDRLGDQSWMIESDDAVPVKPGMFQPYGAPYKGANNLLSEFLGMVAEQSDVDFSRPIHAKYDLRAAALGAVGYNAEEQVSYQTPQEMGDHVQCMTKRVTEPFLRTDLAIRELAKVKANATVLFAYVDHSNRIVYFTQSVNREAIPGEGYYIL